jgi:predicted nucleic acid-binding protein
MILVDAGPLVAILHRDDGHHRECVQTLRALRPPLGTTWPVVTEAMYLLGFSTDAQDELWSLIESRRLHLLGLDASDAPRMRALMRRYRDLPMDLADASLVTVAERDGINRVFTLDRRDFRVYRPAKVGHFSIVP